MIDLDKDWVITRDKYQWILSQRRFRKRKGKSVMYLRPVDYYPNLESLVSTFVQSRAMGKEYETLLELLVDQKNLLAQTCTVLEGKLKALHGTILGSEEN